MADKMVAQTIDRLIAPFDSKRTEIADRIRYASGILLVIIVFALVTLTIFTIVGYPINFQSWHINLALVGLVAAYAVTRMGYPNGGIWLGIVAIVAGLIVNATPPQVSAASPFLLYLIIPILLAALFLSMAAQILVNVSVVGIVAALPLLYPDHIVYDDLMVNALVNLSAVSLMALGLGLARRTLTQRTRLQAALFQTLSEEHDSLLTRATIITRAMSDFTYEVRLEDGDPERLSFDNIEGAFERLTGYPRNRLIKPETLSLIHEADRERVRKHLQTAWDGKAHTIEARIITRDGQTRWVQNHAYPRINAQGDVVSLICIAHDITDRTERENALSDHAIRQAVVAELGQRALSDVYTTHQIIRHAATLIRQALTADYVRIIEIAPDQRTVIFDHRISDKTDEPEQIYSVAEPPLADAIRRGVVINIDDSAHDRRYEQVAASGFASMVCVPLIAHAAPVGVMVVCRTEHNPFSKEVVDFLKSVANVLTSLIEQKRTQVAEDQQRAIIEAQNRVAAALNSSLGLEAVLDTILDNLPRIVPHDFASIMLVEGDHARIIRHRGFPAKHHAKLSQLTFNIRTDSAIRRMIRERSGLIWLDVHKEPGWRSLPEPDMIRCYMGVPIFHQDTLIGVLNVDHSQPNSFTGEHLSRVQSFADQASIAIRNANHTRELEKRVAQRTAELEREQRHMQTILDGTAEGIYYAENHVIQYINPALAAMTGYQMSDIIGQNSGLFIVETRDEENWRRIRAYLRDHPVWRGEVIVERADGVRFEAGATVSTIEWHDDRLRTVTLLRDISEQKALQEQKMRFIANASHELRSPLTSINTRIYLMQRDPMRMVDHIQMFRYAVDRMNRLIEDLLDMSRFQNGVIRLQRRNVIMQQVISDTIGLHEIEAQQREIELVIDLDPDPLNVHIDPDRIGQVLTNLINNALSYTPNGGRVTVRLQHDEQAVIQVQDTGIGIAPEELESVFQPFYRGEQVSDIKGTGLGLCISREIALLHGGDLSVQSQVGVGSVFQLRLPTPESEKSID